MAFTLSLSAATPQTVTVDYATTDLTGPIAGGPPPLPAATAGVDYQATTGTVTFAPGQTTATVTRHGLRRHRCVSRTSSSGSRCPTRSTPLSLPLPGATARS